MFDSTLYWTIIAGIVGALWKLSDFLRDRNLESIKRSSELFTRCSEDYKLIIEKPEIQMYLSQNAKQSPEYFHSEEILDNPLFYKAKSFAYRQIDMFDEILSLSSMTNRRFSLIRPLPVVEIKDWKEYIKIKLRHPLYRSILKYEKDGLGEAFNDFCKENKKWIEGAVDPLSW